MEIDFFIGFIDFDHIFVGLLAGFFSIKILLFSCMIYYFFVPRVRVSWVLVFFSSVCFWFGPFSMKSIQVHGLRFCVNMLKKLKN